MSAVSAFYSSVVNEVIDNLKIQFNEEGIDPAALNDLKELWEKKIKESGALDPIHKPSQVPQANHFTAMIPQNGSMPGRITTINNAGARLIKPSGQGTIINEQGYQNRVTVPIYQVQQGNPYRGNTMAAPVKAHRNTPSSSMYGMYGNNQLSHNYDYMFQQALKESRLRQEVATSAFSYRNSNAVPMMLNTNPQQGVALFSSYHNIVPNQGNINAHIIQDNIVNLRKNQTDGADDRSSDEDEFVNVSEADPQSVRTPYLKKEIKQDDSDDDLGDEIDVINNSSIPPSKAEDSEEDDDVDDDKEKDDSKDEAPLNSEDDISDDDPEKIFETDNVIVCQYDKVSRTRNKWKLNFVSGIANLYGKDTVFHKAVGEAEW